MRQILTIGALGVAILLPLPRAAEAGCPATKEVQLSNGKTRKQPAVGKVERTLGGQIITSKKDFPGGDFDSAGAYINRIKSQNEKRFWEDKAKKQWRIYFAAFFKKPVDDLEVQIRLYDVTGGQSTQMASFPQDLDYRCETSIISSLKLDRESFGVNKKVLMVMESRGARIATGTFEIIGEREKFSGKAEFTDEDTREEGAPPPPPPEDRPDPVPDKDPELDKPIDYDDPALNSPNLDPEEGFQEPPPQRKANRGCGCRADGSAGGGLLLAGLALAFLRRRRR